MLQLSINGLDREIWVWAQYSVCVCVCVGSGRKEKYGYGLMCVCVWGGGRSGRSFKETLGKEMTFLIIPFRI